MNFAFRKSFKAYFLLGFAGMQRVNGETGDRFSRTMFDVRVFHPNAPSSRSASVTSQFVKQEGEAATIRATSKGRRRSIFCTTGLLHFWRNGPSRRVDLQAVGKPALREIGPELLCNGECRAVSSIVCASAFGHHCSPRITSAAS